MNRDLLYHVKFDANCDIEGRVLYEGEQYPVFKKSNDYIILCAENGDFCFSNELMKSAIEEWNLEVVNV
ncbi:hypothetical protein [Lysinibacillus sp. FSL K6-0102]|uniref:hypothetical protein n=1 Tax=Lysinibacillus sp. FSL K6-0102 TaxID=2975290 RepID=UPI0030F8976C